MFEKYKRKDENFSGNLARKANITPGTYSQLENWQAGPSGLTLLNLAKVVNDKPQTIFFNSQKNLSLIK